MSADKPRPSSMKISLHSPNRPGYSREPPPIALSTSLSRRLSNSRSIKGGASPAMFPVTGKKRGCGFDNPEPSSPKVTCIGQVRVKSKKKYVKNIRGSLSRRRKLEHSRSQRKHVKCLQMPQRNSNSNNGQRWVHIPPTICEAVSCLFPCRSSCWSTENEEKIEERKRGRCGAVVGRWLVALQDGDANVGDRREIELVKGEDDGNEMDVVGNPRRHVFDDLEIVNDVILGSKDESKVSMCVPPKNALLLMRCRSDPLKMEALTNRFWEPTMEIHEEKYENEGEICQEEIKEDGNLMVLDGNKDQEHEQEMEEIKSEMEMKQSIEEEDGQEQSRETNDEEESFFLGDLFEDNADQDQDEDCDMEDAQEELVEDEDVETEESNIEKAKRFEEGTEEMLPELPEFTAEILEETYGEIEAGESSIVKVKEFEEGIEEMLPECTAEILEEIYGKIEAGESSIVKVKEFEEGTEEMLPEFTTEILEETYGKIEAGDSSIVKVKEFEEGIEEMLPEFTAEILVETYEEIEARDSSIVKVKQFEEMLTEVKKRSEIPEETYEEIEAGESNIEKVIHFEEKTNTDESNIEKVKQLEEEIKERSEIPEETYEETETTGESNLEKVKQLEEEIEEVLTEFEEISEVREETYEETETTGESNIEKVIHFEEETKTGESNSNTQKVKEFEDEIEEMLTELKERSEIQDEEIEALPECLLLMMYDPKLSSEVSKETWMSSSDFSRRHSRKKPTPPQPARSSRSFPASRSMIAVLEQKLLNTMGFEPLELTRCKSEPLTTAAGRLAPESCCWQNQLEPPRRASFGVGMAGLGLGFCQFGS